MRMFLLNLLGMQAVLCERLAAQAYQHRKETTDLLSQHAATIMRIENRKEPFCVEVKQGSKGRWRAFIRDSEGDLLMSSAPHGFETEDEAEAVVFRVFNGRRKELILAA